jgi:hypothetical protein
VASSGWRRVARDLRDRRFIDVYSVAIVAFVLALVSLIGYGSSQLRWSVVLAALGLLVLRISVPETAPDASLDDLLRDRFAFDAIPLADRLRDAREVWIFAPSGVNLLIPGSFQYRLLAYNPGFSLVAIDPSTRGGRLIVEFHAFHNEATSSRMHVEITRKQSDRWYSYWSDQFERIWAAATPPEI